MAPGLVWTHSEGVARDLLSLLMGSEVRRSESTLVFMPSGLDMCLNIGFEGLACLELLMLSHGRLRDLEVQVPR